MALSKEMRSLSMAASAALRLARSVSSCCCSLPISAPFPCQVRHVRPVVAGLNRCQGNGPVGSYAASVLSKDPAAEDEESTSQDSPHIGGFLF
jgi:hypothetical protein